MLKRMPVEHNAGVLLVDDRRRMLLVHVCTKGYAPPGGKIDRSDANAFAAARREFHEECASDLPGQRHDYRKLLYRNRTRVCALFINKKPLTSEQCDNIVRAYRRERISWNETNDLAFWPVSQILKCAREVRCVGAKHGVCDRLARFVPRVVRFFARKTNASKARTSNRATGSLGTCARVRLRLGGLGEGASVISAAALRSSS